MKKDTTTHTLKTQGGDLKPKIFLIFAETEFNVAIIKAKVAIFV